MKNLKFIFCSFLILALSFTVAAHTVVKENQKTEMVKPLFNFHQADVTIVATTTLNANFQPVAFVFKIVPKGCDFSRGIITDTGWPVLFNFQDNTIYKEKLNTLFLPDFREQLLKLGIRNIK